MATTISIHPGMVKTACSHYNPIIATIGTTALHLVHFDVSMFCQNTHTFFYYSRAASFVFSVRQELSLPAAAPFPCRERHGLRQRRSRQRRLRRRHWSFAGRGTASRTATFSRFREAAFSMIISMALRQVVIRLGCTLIIIN